MKKEAMTLMLATAVAAIIGAPGGAFAEQAGKEKCYGIALAGKNDCAAAGNNSCAGTTRVDYDKKAWKYVAEGTCNEISVELRDGTMRMGSLEPIGSGHQTGQPFNQ